MPRDIRGKAVEVTKSGEHRSTGEREVEHHKNEKMKDEHEKMLKKHEHLEDELHHHHMKMHEHHLDMHEEHHDRLIELEKRMGIHHKPDAFKSEEK